MAISDTLVASGLTPMLPKTIRRSLSAPLSPIATGATADGPEPPFYASAQDRHNGARVLTSVVGRKGTEL